MNYELKMRKNILFLFCALFCAGLVLPRTAQAAEIFFVSSNQKPTVGELFKVDFFINTEEENVNTVAGTVIFPTDLLEFKEIRDGNSMINLWVNRPELKMGGEIVFAGITPGGYKGKDGLLFSLIFSPKKSGSVNLSFTDSQVLLNDGKGTEIKVTAPVFTLQVTEKSSDEQVDYSINDKTPPELFTPEIAQDKNIVDGKWFVVFTTQDKDSGIDHYEVQESRNNNPDGSWEDTLSSHVYVLQDQTLQSYVYIKAVDKAGNVTVAKINPKNHSLQYLKWFIYAILLIVAIIFAKKLWRKRGG